MNPEHVSARFVGYAMNRVHISQRKQLLIWALRHIANALTVMTSKEEAAMELYAVGDQTMVRKEAA